MPHQLNILLLILGASQGALMSWYLLRKKSQHLANNYFILILVTIGLQMTFKVISKMWLTHNIEPLYFMSYNLPYLIGPLLYLYVRSRRGVPFKWIDLIHFFPFAWSSTEVILQENAGYWASPIAYLILPAMVRAVVQGLSLMVYAWLSWRLIQQERQSPLRSFILGVTAVELVIIIALTVMYVNYPKYTDARLLFISLTVLVYWISYKHLEQPDLFVMFRKPQRATLLVQPHTKYKNSGLKEGEGLLIAQRLQQMMTDQKLYLDPDLTLESLARKLEISRHTLSQVLNERFQKSYLEFVNEFRLAEAQTRLNDPKYKHYTIAAIAMDSGFNSLSRFNENFRKRLGMTPSAFRDRAANRMSA